MSNVKGETLQEGGLRTVTRPKGRRLAKLPPSEYSEDVVEVVWILVSDSDRLPKILDDASQGNCHKHQQSEYCRDELL
jgi:hypothetical protein